MSRSRRHHFVPKMLSKRFVNGDGHLWYFDSYNKRHGIQSVTPNGAFWARDLNTLEDSAGVKSDDAERFFNSTLEEPCNTLLDSLTEQVISNSTVTLSPDERTLLNDFVYFQFKRTPDANAKFMGDVPTETDISHLVNEYEQNAGRRITPEERAQIFSVEGQKKIAQRGRVLASTALADEEVTKALSSISAWFLVAPKSSSFVLGSDPVLRFGGRLDSEGAALVLPISKRTACVWGTKYRNGTIVHANKNQIRSLNESTARESTAIASCAEPLTKSLSRFVQVTNLRRAEDDNQRYSAV